MQGPAKLDYACSGKSGIMYTVTQGGLSDACMAMANYWDITGLSLVQSY